jgi:histidinol dehydrogenase
VSALELAWRGPVAGLSPTDRTRLVERRPARGPGSDASAASRPGPSDGPDEREDTRARVREIIRDVRTRGDAALLEMARRFDGVDSDGLDVPRERWREALDALDPGVRAALERAARNIEAFHRAQVPGDVEVETEPGVRLGRRFVPLARVGVYAPGGLAAYPSSVLMGVVPARAAGVGEVVVCSPPGPNGLPAPPVLAAAAVGGADRLVAAGGAGAVAAMAYGTASVPRCDAVVGPGNRWVLEAKRQVAADVVIDSPAGPSEVLVVADATADPGRIADELVAQAEHDPDAAVVLVATDPDVLEAAEAALAERVATTPRRDVVRAALAARGALLLASDADEALALAREWAPEHLSLLTARPRADLERVPTAGTAFLGGSASVAHGDYLTGANHVLPTEGTARSYGGLSTLHFMRSYTWQEVGPDAAARLVDAVEALAGAEGLPAHGAAARGAARASEGARS